MKNIPFFSGSPTSSLRHPPHAAPPPSSSPLGFEGFFFLLLFSFFLLLLFCFSFLFFFGFGGVGFLIPSSPWGQTLIIIWSLTRERRRRRRWGIDRSRSIDWVIGWLIDMQHQQRMKQAAAAAQQQQMMQQALLMQQQQAAAVAAAAQQQQAPLFPPHHPHPGLLAAPQVAQSLSLSLSFRFDQRSGFGGFLLCGRGFRFWGFR